MVEPAGEKEQRHRAEVAEARPGWYFWTVMIVTAVMASGAAVGVSKYNQRQSEQAWCDVVNALNDGFANPEPGAPPLTARGEKLARGIAAVGRKYNC